ncbi:hypothetical protein [Cupriavidus basilensis]|uniref:hypothetical protein n=1 Tax=Cupriavidus basilensis TaxID=68895 RepID=UPI00157B0829|nr:hypothetical protein [Cupriavidus basilensis]NUA29699.1 glycosyltransferase family 1 protein [Cupriavidus basilensis]
MRRFNFLVFPYRDYYFLKKFGPIVRDLHVLEGLANSPRVKSVTVVNRPVSVYERVIGKASCSAIPGFNVKWRDRTSLDLFGPLRRRKWLTSCYSEHELSGIYDPECINVILDFTPLSVIDYKSIGFDFVWYDLIDNFAKHNRYDYVEREYVRNKYLVVARMANLITGVSQAAVSEFAGALVTANGVGLSREKCFKSMSQDDVRYDFGFLGFITDKLDCSLVEKIAGLGYSCVIYGESYDKSVTRRLSGIKNVTLRGGFSANEVPLLMGSFKVGLIPYIREKLHDESPLKLYQYLAFDRPVLSSAQFEIKSEYVYVYEGGADSEIEGACEALIEMYNLNGSKGQISKVINDTDFWEYKINSLLDRIIDKIG